MVVQSAAAPAPWFYNPQQKEDRNRDGCTIRSCSCALVLLSTGIRKQAQEWLYNLQLLLHLRFTMHSKRRTGTGMIVQSAAAAVPWFYSPQE
jgi:hypothetical protein